MYNKEIKISHNKIKKKRGISHLNNIADNFFNRCIANNRKTAFRIKII